jgi:hypothetical protein
MPSAKKKRTGRTTAETVLKKAINGPLRLETSLDAICDMAWRIASTQPQFLTMVSGWLKGEEIQQDPYERMEDNGEPISPFDIKPADELMDTWRYAFLLADNFIAEVKRLQSARTEHEEAYAKEHRFWQDWLNQENANVDITGLTLAERNNGLVSFRRACKLITGLKDGPDAERRFERIFTTRLVFPRRLQTEANLQPLEFYRDYGFNLIVLGIIREAWLKLPKEKLRKGYEKSGRYRRNKQGRKKKPKK